MSAQQRLADRLSGTMFYSSAVRLPDWQAGRLGRCVNSQVWTHFSLHITLHTPIHTRTHTHTQTPIHTHMHTHLTTHTPYYTHTHTHINIYTLTHAHTHARTHVRTHARTHTTHSKWYCIPMVRSGEPVRQQLGQITDKHNSSQRHHIPDGRCRTCQHEY